MSATAIKSLRLHLKFGPAITTADQRTDAFNTLRELLFLMHDTSISLCDQSTWTFAVQVPEGTRFSPLLLGGTFEITSAPAKQPDLSWRQRPNSRASSRA